MAFWTKMKWFYLHFDISIKSNYLTLILLTLCSINMPYHCVYVCGWVFVLICRDVDRIRVKDKTEILLLKEQTKTGKKSFLFPTMMKANLSSHIRHVHLGEAKHSRVKSIPCPHCNKMFSRKVSHQVTKLFSSDTFD